jgi:predicted TIM-barrel enzyme
MLKRNDPKIYPVIHFIDRETAFDEVGKAVNAGADGVFLISHRGDDKELLSVACAIQIKFPTLPVGVNFLSTDGLESTIMARKFGLPMVWGDDLGVDSKGLTDNGLSIRAQKVSGADGIDVFASVAFKYRPHEPNPELAAKNALDAGFIPTTSGSGTGSAPELSKIIAMSEATGGVLAVASGMTPENISEFAPYLSHILVATGVAKDEHRMDVEKLKLLIANSKIDKYSEDVDSFCRKNIQAVIDDFVERREWVFTSFSGTPRYRSMGQTSWITQEQLIAFAEAIQDKALDSSKAQFTPVFSVADAWKPEFDACSPKQEELVQAFCLEIAGIKGQPGRSPDPVRLLEMAQSLYEAELEDRTVK